MIKWNSSTFSNSVYGAASLESFSQSSSSVWEQVQDYDFLVSVNNPIWVDGLAAEHEEYNSCPTESTAINRHLFYSIDYKNSVLEIRLVLTVDDDVPYVLCWLQQLTSHSVQRKVSSRCRLRLLATASAQLNAVLRSIRNMIQLFLTRWYAVLCDSV